MEVSNKTLALFLVAAVVVSIGGTILSLDRLSRVSTVGYATDADTGTATLTIQTLASIKFAINTIDFGTGSVNSSTGIPQCNLTINASNAIAKSNCIGFYDTNNNGAIVDTFIIENDGNADLNITLNSTVNSTEFLGGSATYALFQYTVSNNVSGSGACGGTLGVPTWASFNNVNTNVCTNLSWSAPDTLRVGIRVGIPDDSLTGQRNATLIATGTEFV
jgi:hypothetical protein